MAGRRDVAAEVVTLGSTARDHSGGCSQDLVVMVVLAE